MVRFFAPGIFLVFALVLSAGATENAPDGSGSSTSEQLDQLFEELRHERNERAARRIALRIGKVWRESGSATGDLLMQWADDAVKAKKFSVALDFLDQVVMLYPSYAEGWNRRATVHFMMSDHARAMSDIARTLDLEPRHFGALSGLARILQMGGQEEKALEAYARVLEIYPMMRNAQNALTELSDSLAGQGI